MSSKLLLIGLDAADWDLLSEKVASGKLPHLSRLMQRGTSGPLRSLRPLFSPALWATIATGKRPYQHGITDFVLPTPSGKGLRTYNSSSRSSPAIWEMLSFSHRSSHVVGWWNTAPAEKIQGIMVDETFRIASFSCDQPWPVRPSSVSPSSLAEELASCRVHPQQLSMSLLQRLIPKLYEIDPTVDWRLSAIAKILAEDLTTLQTTLHVMQEHPWDFTSLYLIGLDSFSHQGTSFRHPVTAHANEQGIEHYGELIDLAYDLYDDWIGELVAAAGPETTIMLVSDHGFYHDYRKPPSLGVHATAPCDQHAPIGTFLVAGPNIQAGATIKNATLLDICPTLLALLELPIGRDMKGHVLLDIFKKKPPLSFVHSWDQIIRRSAQEISHEPETQATEIALRQLVALGYLPATPQDHQQIISTAYADHLLHQALSYLEHGRIDAALLLLEQAHHSSPERTDILIELAHAYKSIDAHEQASLALKKFVYHRRRDAWQAYQALQTKNYHPAGTLSTLEILEWRHLAARVNLDNEGLHFLLLFAEWLTTHHEEQADQLCTFAEKRPYDSLFVMQAAEASFFHHWHDRGLSLLSTLAEWKKEDSSPLVMMAHHEYRQGHLEQAYQLSQGALERHPLDHAAWLIFGQTLAAQKKWKEAKKAALQALESFLLRSQAYELLASIACHEESNKTLAPRYQKLATHFKKRLRKLAHPPTQTTTAFLTSSHHKNFPQHQAELDPYYTSSQSSQQHPIIVTGLPRSGTSLLMQMITAGGIDPITDYHRLPDAHNPLGYFEHESIKEISNHPNLLEPGKVAKIVIPLLWDLPRDLSCHVIFIRRPLEEVIISQHRMAGEVVPFKELHKAYISLEAQTAEIMLQRPWHVLQLSHTQLLADPLTAATKINQFLGGYLDVEAMSAVVQPSLHRVKL